MPAAAARMPGIFSRRSQNQYQPAVLEDTDRTHNVQYSNDESASLLPHYSDVERKEKQEKGGQCFEARHTLAVMAFLGFFNVYCLRVNLSVALVAMVNSSHSSTNISDNECPDSNEGNVTTTKSTGEFNWDEQTQGYVLGAFFYGYIVTQLPGGWLASRFGGKKLLGFGILGTALLTLITPFAARYSVYMMIVVRVLEGIGEATLAWSRNRINDGHIRKDVLYSQLASGTGHPKWRYTDVCKRDMKSINIDPEIWEAVADDRDLCRHTLRLQLKQDTARYIETENEKHLKHQNKAQNQ